MSIYPIVLEILSWWLIGGVTLMALTELDILK